MQIKFLSLTGIEIVQISDKKEPPFYSSIELMERAVRYGAQKYGDAQYEFFTGTDIKEHKIFDISITKVPNLRQKILVYANSKEELSKFERAFAQKVNDEWDIKCLTNKIGDLQIVVPNNYESLKQATLRDISTFDFGINLIPKIEDDEVTSVVLNESKVRYLGITSDNVFWMDKDLNKTQTDELIQSWEKYKK